MQLRYEQVERWEVNDIRKSASAKLSDYECEGHRPLSVVLSRCGESTYQQGRIGGGGARKEMEAWYCIPLYIIVD
jgi:hypothetical protein